MFLAYLFVLCSAENLFYNQIISDIGSHTYNFTIIPSGYLTLTASSQSSVHLYLSKGDSASESGYDYTSTNILILDTRNLDATSAYSLKVVSEHEYSLLLSSQNYAALQDDIPAHHLILPGFQDLYEFTAASESSVKFTLSYLIGKADLYVSQSDPAPENSFPMQNWGFGQTAQVKPEKNAKFKLSVVSHLETDYTLIADTGKDIEIKSDMILGFISISELVKYKYVLSSASALRIKLSIFSGDCSLYVKVNSPVSVHDYDWEFSNHGSQIIEITEEDQKQHPGFNYSLGVYGKKDSVYSLTVTSGFKTTEMKTGVPYIGKVNNREIEYYSLEVLEGQELSVHLSAGTGNPDLYAKQCGFNLRSCNITAEEIANPSNIYYSVNAFGIEELSIVAKGNYSIGVYGASAESSEYTIISLLDENEAILRNGQPQTSFIASSGYRYYKHVAPSISMVEMYFILTPISGDPDLYISKTQVPSTTNYESSSSLSGLVVDSVAYIKGRDGLVMVNGTYHVAVYSEGPSRFTVVAKQVYPEGNETVQLYPGMPQKDTMYNMCSQYRLYFFPIRFTQETKQPIRITLTPITGKFNLYATNNVESIDFEHKRFWYQWQSNSTSNDYFNSIFINTASPCYKVNSNYALLVKVAMLGSDGTATYSIVFQVGNGTMILSDNLPFIDIVSSRNYNYYTFPITLSKENIKIAMTSFSGAPRILASVHNSHPSLDSYQFSSKRTGSSELDIKWSELNDLCPSLPDEYHFGDPTHCSVFISIYSEESSTYSLILHTARLIKTLLIIPSTQISLKSFEDKYYYSFASSERSIFINTQSGSGDVKVYVKLYSSLTSDLDEISMPNSTYYDFVSETYMLHSERIVIRARSMAHACGNNCLVMIAVTCLSSECEYFISIAQNDHISLIDGEVFLSSVESGEFTYFSYYTHDDVSFIISLTPISNGDPDLYIRKSYDQLPNLTHYDWIAKTWNSEEIIIDKNDAFFINNNKTMRGVYLIGVYGTIACSFTIRVSKDPYKITKILSGVPEHGNVTLGKMDYYSYKNDIAIDLLIKVTPIYGKAVIYANYQILDIEEQYEKLPTKESYSWSSLEDRGQHSLLIRAGSSKFCVDCNILIGVFGETPCVYTIVATHNSTTTIIENGIPQRGELSRSQWKIYYFEVNQNKDLDISLNTFSGDSDLFVSTEPVITTSNAMWSSSNIIGIDHIIISKNEAKFKIGSFYIEVYSVIPSSYSLTVHLRESFVKLISGWPQTYGLNPADTLYFQFTSESQLNLEVYCNLHPLSENFAPDVLISISNERVYPSLDSSDFRYSLKDYDSFYSSLHMEHKLKLGEKMFIAVNAEKNKFGEFQLYCTGVNDVTVLKFNEDTFEKIQGLRKRVYEVNIEEKGTLSVFVIPCRGDFKIEISSNWTVSNMEIPDLIVTRLTDGRLTGIINNAYGRYYITVSSLSEDPENSYEIITFFTDPRKHYIIVPGNDGKIDIDSVKGGVKVSWVPPQYENLTYYEREVKYFLYKTHNSKLLTACSMMISEEKMGSEMIAATDLTSFTYKKDQNIIFNVIAVLPYDALTVRYIAYDPIRIMPNKDDGGYGTIFWIIIGIILVNLVIIGGFVMRTKIIKKKIEIEVTEKRDITKAGSELVPLSAMVDK